MSRRSVWRGVDAFTMMEILIAMVILLVGLCGVMALFPVAIRSTKQSVEDSTASVVAESVHHALVQAMRLAPPSGGPGGNTVSLVHDGTPSQGGGRWYYQFALPANIGQPEKHPTSSNGTDPSKNVFALGFDPTSTPAIASNAISGIGGTDPTVDYKQYSFAFDVMRVEARPLFEFRIGIYRNYRTATVNWAQDTHPCLLKEFRTLIMGN
jgi:prepilin-type N-terminal cleavage/methylation domain-containing protein